MFTLLVHLHIQPTPLLPLLLCVTSSDMLFVIVILRTLYVLKSVVYMYFDGNAFANFLLVSKCEFVVFVVDDFELLIGKM